MASVRRKRGGILVSLDAPEVALLISLVDQTRQLLAPDPDEAPDDPGDGAADAPGRAATDPLEDLVGLSDAPVPSPADPALARLLPDAYRGDDDETVERAAEFRRFTESELRATKLAALAVIGDALSGSDAAVSLRIDGSQAGEWLHALNDIRLALGTRLDITEDMVSEAEATERGSARWEGLVVYDWLTMVQDSLLTALTGD